MFEIEVVSLFLSSRLISDDTEKNYELCRRANQKSTVAPSARLQWMLDELHPQMYRVQQAAVMQLSDDCLPCLVFLRSEWGVIFKEPGGYSIKFSGGAEEFFSVKADLPPAVALWVDLAGVPSKNSLNDHDETAFGLIKSEALKKPRWLLDLAIATIVVNFFAIITSLFAMQVYDRVVPTLAFSTLYTLSFAIGAVYVFDSLLKFSRSKLLDRKSSEIDKVVSGKIYQHLLDVQTDKLPQQVGTLTAQLTSIESARQFFSSSIIFALVDFPFALLFLVSIYAIAGPVALIYAGFLLLSFVIGAWAQKRSQLLVKKITARSNERLGVLVDSIKGLESIKSIGAKGLFQSDWDSLSASISASSLAQKELNSLASNASAFLSQLAYALAIIVGVHEISAGQMTQGSMVAVSILGGRVLGPAGQIVSYLLQYETTKQSLSMIDSILRLPKDRSRDQVPSFPIGRPTKIVLSDVQFAYSGAGSPQVDIKTLDFNAGDRVAILGAIGSGKSTLLKILAGLYKPSSGFVKINGIDLWQIDQFYLSSSISYLPQTPELFKGTLKSNLTMGKNVSDSIISATIKQINLSSIIDQSEKGIDRPISEGGAGLSSGQKQLVAIARVIINSPAIWLLDEPTSALDAKNQDAVKRAVISQLGPADILVFTTHNPKLAVELATRVIVMEKGSVAQDVPTSKIELRQKNA